MFVRKNTKKLSLQSFLIWSTVTLFQEGLLDRHEFLTCFIEIVEKYKQTDDTILKLALAQILQVKFDITLVVNGNTFRGSNSVIFIFASPLIVGQILKKRLIQEE